MVKDPAKVTCQVHGCRSLADTKVEWKFGKGSPIPFQDGVCGDPLGKHFTLNVCPDHRKRAMEQHPRPYRMTQTSWARNPDAHDAVVVRDGVLQFAESEAS